MDTIVLDVRAGATSGALLGAMVEAGASLEAVQGAVATLGSGPVRLAARGGAGDGTFLRVIAPLGGPTGVFWSEIRPQLVARHTAPALLADALSTLDTLMGTRAAVHAVEPGDVELDHLGGPDELAGALALAAAWRSLGAPDVLVSPVGHGTGTLPTLEGDVPLPGPVVTELLGGLTPLPLDVEADLVEPLAAAWLLDHAVGTDSVDDDGLALATDRGPTGRGRVAPGRTLRATLLSTVALA